jgi:hypothetical protein
VVDDENVGGRFDGFELEAQLLLDGGEEAGGGVGFGGVGLVGGEFQGEVVAAGEVGLVDDGAGEFELHLEGEVAHGVALEVEDPLIAGAAAMLVGWGVGVDRGEFRAAFGDGDGVDGEIALLAMELEVEAVGEEFLDHGLKLADVGLTVGVGDSVDIKALGGDPGWGVLDLLHVDGVGDGDEAGYGLVFDQDVAAFGVKALVGVVGIGGLDGSDFKGGVGVGGHAGWGYCGLVGWGGGLGECGGRGNGDGGEQEEDSGGVEAVHYADLFGLGDGVRVVVVEVRRLAGAGSPALVFGGHLDVVDDEGFDGAFCGLEFEAELLLEGGEEDWGFVGLGFVRGFRGVVG